MLLKNIPDRRHQIILYIDLFSFDLLLLNHLFKGSPQSNHEIRFFSLTLVFLFQHQRLQFLQFDRLALLLILFFDRLNLNLDRFDCIKSFSNSLRRYAQKLGVMESHLRHSLGLRRFHV